MEKKIILGLSWGYRDEEGKKTPGLSNQALAKAVDCLQAALPELESALQWEIAACTRKKPIFTIWEHRIKGKYLDSDEAISQAIEVMRPQGIKEILLVAQPFLHGFLCRRLLKRMAPNIKIVPIWVRVPFDKESAQWFVRSRLNAVLYALLRTVTGRRGH